jgi:hypothetical protein
MIATDWFQAKLQARLGVSVDLALPTYSPSRLTPLLFSLALDSTRQDIEILRFVFGVEDKRKVRERRNL